MNTRNIIKRARGFAKPFREEARKSFTQLIGLLKNLNYASQGSPEYAKYLTQIDELVKTLGRTPAAPPVVGVGRVTHT